MITGRFEHLCSQSGWGTKPVKVEPDGWVGEAYRIGQRTYIETDVISRITRQYWPVLKLVIKRAMRSDRPVLITERTVRQSLSRKVFGDIAERALGSSMALNNSGAAEVRKTITEQSRMPYVAAQRAKQLQRYWELKEAGMQIPDGLEPPRRPWKGLTHPFRPGIKKPRRQLSKDQLRERLAQVDWSTDDQERHCLSPEQSVSLQLDVADRTTRDLNGYLRQSDS